VDPTRPAFRLVLAAAALAAATAPQASQAAARHTRATALALPALHAEPDPEAGGRIVDALGREVLLRGVNVNAFAEYWAHDPALFTTYPLTETGVDLIASIGWNCVRLLISWSRVEPAPGVYDEAYLDEVEEAVEWLARHGLYSIIDLHQDAWGPTLAGAPDESCPGSAPAFGWDGAPGWATLDGGAARCQAGFARELTPAVLASFASFWEDAPGPGGVGIRQRYARMLGHVAARFARLDAVAGYDLMNEPNAIYLIPGELDAMADLYADALVEIRSAEDAAGAPHRLVFFEPSITWADLREGVPPLFPHDDQIVYSPHIYQGGISAIPLGPEVFEQARDEAARFGGAPVLSGEWGADPRRAGDPDDDYFERHQALQDEYRFGATLWTFREACGDPHKAEDYRQGRTAYVWGLYEVDCATNETVGLRTALIDALRRPALRAAPGRLARLAIDPARRTLRAAGRGAPSGIPLVAFSPPGEHRPRLRARGFARRQLVPAPGGGWYVVAWTHGGDWSLEIAGR
jgi:endoglycosylceramidase